MPHQTYLETAEDIAWLLSVHIPKEYHGPQYQTAMLYGNEDCPVWVELWLEASEDVMVDTKPALVWHNPVFD